MATNRIKGLTVEIGGDTSKLSDALKDVESRSVKLSTELGDINKLLKFDPKNTELLNQKHKVLAESIEATKEKLETLKKAEKQVQEQFKKGKVSEDQVRALRREIEDTEKRLETYKKQSKESSVALQALGDAAEKAKTAVTAVGKATLSAGKTMANVSATSVKAIATGVTALVGAMVASAEATREYRGEMGKLETAFSAAELPAQAATNTYKELYSVIGETDQAVEASQQIALLASSSKDAAEWADLAAGVVGRFGDALQPETFFEAANETIKLGEATGAYTQMLEGTGYDVEKFNKGLAACKTEQEKQAYMLGITKELLGEAAGKYRETNAEVIRANEANEAWQASMAEVGAEIEPIVTDVKMLGASLLSDLVPGVKGVAEAFRGIINGEDGAAANLGTALTGIFNDLLQKLTNLAPQLIEVAINVITELSLAIVEALPQLTTTIIDLLIKSAPSIGKAATEMMTAIIKAVPDIVVQLVKAAPDIIMGLIEGMMDALPDLKDAVLDLGKSILDGIKSFFGIHSPSTLMAEMGGYMVAGIVNGLKNMPDKMIQTIKSAVTKVKQWGADLLSAVKTAATNMLNNATSLLQQMPGKIYNAIQGAISKVSSWGSSLVSTAKSAASNMFNAVVNAISGLPGSLWNIGSDLVSGLWNGISDKLGWLTSQISGFGSSVLNSVKKVFGVHSPSTETAWIGEMLDEGLAKGVKDNASDPIKAMRQLSGNMLDEAGNLNGLTLERQLNHTFAAPAGASVESGMLSKLDSILAAIEKGQVLLLDGDAMVGGTVGRMDAALGRRRALTVRGAI